MKQPVPMACSSLVTRPPPFLPSILHNKYTGVEDRGGPESIHHVNDVRWMRGGRKGGVADCQNYTQDHSFEHLTVFSNSRP